LDFRPEPDVYQSSSSVDTSISGGATASFVYDGLGRRRSKTVAGVQTGFVYDGENFVEEITVASDGQARRYSNSSEWVPALVKTTDSSFTR
jgi:YD repeat-containing protein